MNRVAQYRKYFYYGHEFCFKDVFGEDNVRGRWHFIVLIFILELAVFVIGNYGKRVSVFIIFLINEKVGKGKKKN